MKDFTYIVIISVLLFFMFIGVRDASQSNEAFKECQSTLEELNGS